MSLPLGAGDKKIGESSVFTIFSFLFFEKSNETCFKRELPLSTLQKKIHTK